MVHGYRPMVCFGAYSEPRIEVLAPIDLDSLLAEVLIPKRVRYKFQY